MQNPSTNHESGQNAYWRRVRRFTLILLLIWFALTFCVIFFARELSAFEFFDLPLSSYMAAQGVILIDVLIVGFYAWRMDRLDRQHGNEQ